MAQENEHKFYVTKEGLDELKKEQDNLIHVVRQEVIVELQEARAQGDLSENADYDAARDHQAQVEARIRELENMISNAVIIEGDKEETYTIVGSIEADPLNGRLSNITPLAVALMDHKVNEVVHITNVEEPYDVKILDLK